ncbi:MFS transporter [Sphingomonas alpina]|uniref:MFS transporter n=1 Tax=Sphingomonas alpina TaxID=653931 RepID=A0A7H0LK47_9SPHN|nr:MFS transporter [Sphingomonas alpina]QNQ10050.1 MFS transporter [Sphingomonas alpina]
MIETADRPATRLATRLAFLVAGFVMACWAPLVPAAKMRAGVNEAELGMLLLCLGIGSILAMPVTGIVSARIGSRPMILLGGVGISLVLPLLAIASSPALLGMALLLFGASLGTIDVAANAHAVEVEKAAGTPLMSGFHALFSVGGFAGAGLTTSLLALSVAPLLATIIAALMALAAIAYAGPRLLRARPAVEDSSFVLPRGVVLLLAALAAVTFLAEGALLDWSALLIDAKALTPPSLAGLGYMLFSIAMTIGRFSGDAIVTRLGGRLVLRIGGLVAVLGFVVLLTIPVGPVAMAGFILIGLGASNIVPVLFSAAGKQQAMPAGMAIAAITTTGYAGILAGPAVMGFVAHLTSLATAFWMLAALLCLVPLFAARVSKS